MLVSLCSGFILVGPSHYLAQFSVIISLTSCCLDAYLDPYLDHFSQANSQPWVGSTN